MNELFKQLDQFKDKPKISLFLDWKTINHNFEEVRIWLTHARSEIEKSGERVPLVVQRILEDHRVFGSELNILDSLTLGEEYAAIYISGENLLALSTPQSVKDRYFIGDEFFILPLLKPKYVSGILALFVQQELVRAFRVNGYKNIVDVTDDFDFPQGASELSHFSGDIESSKNGMQQGEIPKQVDHKQDYKEELLRKYTKEIAAQVVGGGGNQYEVHVFASSKIGSFLKNEIEKLNKNFEILVHSLILSSSRDVGKKKNEKSGRKKNEKNRIRKLLIDKVVAARILNSFEEEEEDFKTAPVTCASEILWAYETGNLRTLHLNRGWLQEAMNNNGSSKNYLKSLNCFVLNFIRRGGTVKLSNRMSGMILAGELYGEPTRRPSQYLPEEFALLRF